MALERRSRVGAALAERPVDEPLAEALGRVFVEQYVGAPSRIAKQVAQIRLAVSTPALQGEYLKAMARWSGRWPRRSHGAWVRTHAICTRGSWQPPLSPPPAHRHRVLARIEPTHELDRLIRRPSDWRSMDGLEKRK